MEFLLVFFGGMSHGVAWAAAFFAFRPLLFFFLLLQTGPSCHYFPSANCVFFRVYFISFVSILCRFLIYTNIRERAFFILFFDEQFIKIRIAARRLENLSKRL
jgi:hypothetical protein